MTGMHLDLWSRPQLIMVATDLSDLDRLMPFALQLAVASEARLLLLHVVAAGEGIAVDTAGMPYYDPTIALVTAQQTMEPWCEMARRQSLVCDALVREGHASEQIGKAIREFRPDRLLLGTRSRGKLGKLFLGSVAEQVLRSVNLPVMTVGPEAHLPVESSDEARIVLHATTLREASRPSVALACQIAARWRAKLLLLHVLPVTNDGIALPASLDAATLHELRALAEETGAGCCTAVESLVVHGNPAIEILAQASERRASLIVLGATQHTAFENLTRERTIYRVLAHARCPVLTLREPRARSTRTDEEQQTILR